MFISGTYRLRNTDVKLYAVTNKRIFMLVITPKFREGTEFTVHSSDYDALQQISIERREDGSGKLTFGLTLAGALKCHSLIVRNYQLIFFLAVNPIRKDPYANPFAFENITDVTRVKNLIENFKSTHQKV